MAERDYIGRLLQIQRIKSPDDAPVSGINIISVETKLSYTELFDISDDTDLVYKSWVVDYVAGVVPDPISLATIGSSPNANGATLTGQVLNLEPASASFGGVVTTGSQTFAGAKTFTDTTLFTKSVASNAFGNIIRNESATGYSTYRLYNDQNSATRSLQIDYTGSGNVTTILAGGLSGEFAALHTTGAYPIQFGINNTFYGILSSSGKWGINTTTPLAQMAINGGLHVGGDSDPGDNNLLVDGIGEFSGNVLPVVSGTPNLGSTTKMWGSLFLGSGGVINWNNGTFTLTQSGSGLIVNGSLGATGSRITKVWSQDIESSNMPTVGGTSLSSTFAPIASPSFTGTMTSDGAISSNVTANAIFSAAAGGTSVKYMNMANTGGTLLMGVTSSTGTGLASNIGNYAAHIYTSGSTNLSFGTGGIYGFYIDASQDVIYRNLGTNPVYSNGGKLTNTNPSDERLKNNFQPLQYGLKEILRLNPGSFYYNSDKENEYLTFGNIAQHVQGFMPELVRRISKTDDHWGFVPEGINTVMIKAMQEMYQELQDLKNKYENN